MIYTKIFIPLGIALLTLGAVSLYLMQKLPVTTPQEATTMNASMPATSTSKVAAGTSTSIHMQTLVASTTMVTKPSTSTIQSAPTSHGRSISIKDYAFSPATLTIKKGTTVTWTNEDIAKHTVTGDSGGPSSDFFGKGESYSYTFATAGTFPYHCEPHPYMTATIIVTE